MRTQNTIIALEIDGETSEYYIEYEYYRACRGARDSLGGMPGAGPPLEPDEPEHCEIIGVMKEKGGDCILSTLSEKQVGLLEERCLDEVAQPDEDYGE